MSPHQHPVVAADLAYVRAVALDEPGSVDVVQSHHVKPVPRAIVAVIVAVTAPGDSNGYFCVPGRGR